MTNTTAIDRTALIALTSEFKSADLPSAETILNASEADAVELDTYLRETLRTGEYPSTTPALMRRRTVSFRF